MFFKILVADQGININLVDTTMIKIRLPFLLIISIISSSTLAFSKQDPEIKNIGLPLITNYEPTDYDFNNQNFDVEIGDDGHIYFANADGILVYNGKDWIRLPLPNQAAPYYVSKSNDGTIFIGGVNEIGYLNSTGNGELSYVSLKTKLSADVESFLSPVLQINGKVIFNSFKNLFVYNIETEEMKTSPINRSIPLSQNSLDVVSGQLYSYSKDSLLLFSNDLWTPIRASQLKLNTFGDGHLVEFKDGQVIAVTTNGFFDFYTEEEIETSIGLRGVLKDQFIYSIQLITEQYIAICTWNGLLIVDKSGRLIKRIDKDMGLADNFVYSSSLDASGMLWVATNNGISKIDIFSQFSILDDRLGIDAVITDAMIHDDQLYVGSFSGILLEDWESLSDPSITPSFEYINDAVVHGLLSITSGLLTLNETNPNIIYTGDTKLEIGDTGNEAFWSGAEFVHSEDLLLGSTIGSILHVSKNRGAWEVKNVVESNLKMARHVVIDKNETIWITSPSEGVFRLDYDPISMKLAGEKKYAQIEGLPSNVNNFVSLYESELIVATTAGIYRYNKLKDAFEPDERFKDLVGQETIITPIRSSDNSLFYFTDQLHILKKNNTGWEKTPLLNLDYKKYLVINTSVIDDKNVMLSTSNGLFHLDPTIPTIQTDFKVNLSLFSSTLSDSVFYGGFGNYNPNIVLDATDNEIRFEFSSTYSNLPEQTLYRWQLVGMDENRSPWSSEWSKDYTNLSHGDYTFEVMAKNTNGKKSAVTYIHFTIETPWYFTIWAYIVYSIGFFLVIWAIVKIYTRRLVYEKNKLELIVIDRTKEISLQKEKVERDSVTISEQHTKLLQMDELKDRFFLNISHELRTPLTLIKGTMHNTLTGKYGSLNEKQSASLEISLQNSNRLINMVNNILDISKLELGKIDLHIEKCKPSSILSKVIAFFASKFTDNNISFKRSFDSDVELYLDTEKFETIFINLIANAFKFTPSGGLIAISVTEEDNALNFFVKDSGVGIPENEIGFVFDRFYQSAHGKSGEGVGVGLALTKELVELHKGQISVKNNDDEGIEFKISFLKGKAHLSPDQIVNETVNTPKKTIQERYPLADESVTEDKIFTPNKENHISDASPHILLVEDNREMSAFIAELLSESYQVSLAENGQEGIDFLKENKPDLILTDYLMPVMNGYEMAVEIKKTNNLAYIPMMFLTARNQESDKIDVLNLGVDDYLLKPFNNDELLIRINNLLHNKNQRDEFLNQEPIDPQEIDWKEFNSKLKIDLDNYIKEHITEEITVEALTDFTANSDRSLFRKVKANTGLSLMQYIKEYRLRRARTLLENKEVRSVSEASYAVGFNYLSHFTKNYKERFGKNPSEYLA